MTQKPKIAILHDAFLYRGGGERLVTLMAKSLDADLIAGFFSDGSFDPGELGFEGKMIPLGKPVFMKGIRHLVLKWRFFWRASILKDYDIVIFSGDCLGALRHVDRASRKVYYCHTPPRYLYDFREKYLDTLPFFLRPFFALAFRIFAHIYERHLARFDHIYTNSQNVHDRLLDFCHYESEILYPPTDISRFAPMKNEKGKMKNLETFNSYFLSFARLSPPKRVHLIVEAFLMMPEKHLILTYGKNDPLKETILAKIQSYPNIMALESPDDQELISLIQGATATIYIPLDEDFGMSPVESMACGTPVIGVNEGGLLETVQEGKTGKLIVVQDDVTGIMKLKDTVESTTLAEWKSMQDACVFRAKDFSLEKFQERLQSLLH